MDKSKWNDAILENSKEFTQSWQWGVFQESLGRRVERIKTENFLVSVIFHPLPLGLEYGYVPRGPVVRGDVNKKEFWGEFEKIKSKKTVFFTFDLATPVSFLSPTTPTTRQPKSTIMVDLKRQSEDLFLNFHHALRRNIRLSEKKGVVIKKETDWREFFTLYRKNSRHHNIRGWDKSYFKNLWEMLSPGGGIEIWSAYKDDQILSSNLYILFGGRATYLFGGSDYKYRSLMSPHLLHWQVMKKFKEQGVLKYDFGGIDKDRWPGVTTFKERFGGKVINYPGSYKKIEKAGWYKLYKLAKKWA